MQTRIEIEGFAEMVKMLDQLPDRLQKQAILNIERKSTKPIIQAARAKLKGKGTGDLVASIGNITAISKNPIIYVGPRLKGKYKDTGYTAMWVEYGTKGIIKKKGKKGGYKRAKDNPDFAWIGALKKGSRYRADQPAKPFMRPAIDEKTPAVKDLFISNMKEYLNDTVAKAIAKLKR